MPHTATTELRESVGPRQLRLARTALVVGALSTGVLLLNQLTEAWRESIFLYYGVSDLQYREVQAIGVGAYELSLAQIAIGVLGLVGVLVFALLEQRRIAKLRAHQCECGRSDRLQGVAPLSLRQRIDTFTARTAMSGGALLAWWLLQTSYLRYMSGYGWGLEVADWTSLLPLASIVGMCLLVGTVVAAMSMFGLRVIFALEAMLDSPKRRIARTAAHAWAAVLSLGLTFRDRFGFELLSRPPPGMKCA